MFLAEFLTLLPSKYYLSNVNRYSGNHQYLICPQLLHSNDSSIEICSKILLGHMRLNLNTIPLHVLSIEIRYDTITF